MGEDGLSHIEASLASAACMFRLKTRMRLPAIAFEYMREDRNPVSRLFARVLAWHPPLTRSNNWRRTFSTSLEYPMGSPIHNQQTVNSCRPVLPNTSPVRWHQERSQRPIAEIVGIDYGHSSPLCGSLRCNRPSSIAAMSRELRHNHGTTHKSIAMSDMRHSFSAECHEDTYICNYPSSTETTRRFRPYYPFQNVPDIAFVTTTC